MKNILLLLSTVLLALPVNAYISVSPGYLSFGTVEIGRSSLYQTVYVFNRGRNNEYVNVGGYCSEYDVVNFCYWLSPNQMCTISVSLIPRTEGFKNCTIYVSGTSGFQMVQANGIAVAPPSEE